LTVPSGDTPAGQTEAAALREKFDQVRAALAAALAGHKQLVDRLLIATVIGGHVLIEGSPGLAKTRTVNRFAQLVNADFARIQATPDLLPSDITGTNIYQQASGSFSFMRGPLFNNIVLVDEINRAPPKVQSALLEAIRLNTKAPIRCQKHSSIAFCFF